jgi:hypothetical protein
MTDLKQNVERLGVYVTARSILDQTPNTFIEPRFDQAQKSAFNE